MNAGGAYRWKAYKAFPFTFMSEPKCEDYDVIKITC